ncbi:MAG: tRNA (N(6)-L-threonylcarbamoyladenosine(37)-C(2))-methylthiotransferase MtaB [Planctomycetes bacterium]|nr:tRNA (N(6)-L-threonylcarbamoyladenosine(37)-C(2))-methylthiotransferase MtaB [Planctomycetota bacterium]
MPTCRLVTLGCKVNQYETQYVKEALEINGYREAADGERADLCIVNTCTVTGEGDAKSRTAVRRLNQHNPDARIVVMGCYATRDPAAVANLPGVVRVVTDKASLADDLRDFGVETLPAGITRFDDHQRAFVKVQDGCLLNCTYCIIPSVRPSLRSRSIDAISAEVSDLVASGYHEIVLTGVHLGHYGLDASKGKPKAEWRRLWHLLDGLDRLPGDFRVRLSSLEAAEARDDLVRAMSRSHRVVPHLHLCLQSGSDRILLAMKRRYTSGSFLRRVERLKQALDAPAFTTDVIVGFPGETDADFEATLNISREVGFAKIHIFSYSPRAGTPAARLPGAVPPAIMKERCERLRAVERATATAYRESMLGRNLDVLVEGADPRRADHAQGTSCRYVPVSFRGHAPALMRTLVTVRATRVEGDLILGEPVADVLNTRVSLL